MEDTYYLNKILDHITAMVVILDKQCRIIKINKICREVTGYTLEEIKDKFFWDVFISQGRGKYHHKLFINNIQSNYCQTFNFCLFTSSGREMLNRWSFSYIDSPNHKSELIIATGIDITDSNQRQERLLRYLSMHDPVTGLYNRAYFEEEMNRLENSRHNPIGMIIGDIDGLKLINDTMGHEFGDVVLAAMAKLLRNSFRREDVVVRIGGDEFAVLFSKTSEKALEEACGRIQEAIKFNNKQNIGWPLSISLGYAIRENQHKTMKDLFKEAEKSMFKQKHNGVSKIRRTFIENLRRYLLVRNNISELEVKRLETSLKSIVDSLKFPTESKMYLTLLSQYHNIGTIGISESIMKKPGILSPEEYNEVQKHCEIGFRIAWAVPDLAPIAELILKHHEQWDGKGYPLGLKGVEIPLECRTFSIVKAFISMTSKRPHRKELSHEEALRELQLSSGVQFDPVLVELVVKILEEFKT